MGSNDLDDMGCDRWREAISARADGEPPELDARLVDAHLARCQGCRAFDAQVRALTPPRIEVAPIIPDLSARVVREVAAADRARAWGLARILLAVVAIEVIVLSIPELVASRGDDLVAHDARHLGAFSVAYAVGLLVVVWRPARARAVLPVAGVLAGALTITAVVDIAQGRVPLVGEAVHLPEIISVLLVWLLAVPAPRRLDRFRKRRPPPAPGLRVVDDDLRSDAAPRRAV